MKTETFETKIYYLVQGRSLDGTKNYIEHTFKDANPLEARKNAFSHLEYYLQLLHDGKKIFFKEKNAIVNKPVLENINKYDISFAENNLGLDGIAIYMVVNKKVNDKLLIFSIKNLSHQNIETIKNNLIKELSFYHKLNIDTSKNQDSLMLVSNNNITNNILKTPSNLFLEPLKTYESYSFTEKVAHDFKVIDLYKTTFISKLDWHIINKHIASFLNTEGGKIYLGKIHKYQIISCVDESNIEAYKQLLKKNISSNFPLLKHLLLFKYVKINKVLVPIIEIKVSNRKFSFYDIIKNNDFYIRTQNGIKTINDTQKIAQYVMDNSEFRLTDLNAILDLL